ncbi:type I-E CRISPR-associated protein Cas6/Cse3/CasE [Streptomyces sp. NRRL F-5630]|uniref:type I-E CRISPR-associated protein Cas6/Cse3/CasE n=1 Tax=Streptomyces sp. NRRL F-5630 TaxID=1463864 RepID=UPI0004C47E6B|nr:type I-E CRISPR-associated protein Cas6/Cse3/CasE [Streptomyces sp. NRRL F-5630]
MSLWLTRLAPGPASRIARDELAGLPGTSLHRRVMSLFPDDTQGPARARYQVLYRVEDTARGSHLLIQSNHRPDPGRLPDGYGTLTTRPLDALLEALQDGLPLHYRCAASPVRKPTANTRALYNLPAVVALKGSAADEWWQRQAENAGLKLLSQQAQPLDTVHDRQAPAGTSSGRSGRSDGGTGKSQNNRVRHQRIRFDGTATIADTEQLRAALVHGIGPGKAYGCGLLSIAPTTDAA